MVRESSSQNSESNRRRPEQGAEERERAVRDGTGRAVTPALLATGVCAVAFTLFAVLTTQDKSVRATSPWQDDPYTGVVSFTLFLVPILVGLMALRALAWRRMQGRGARVRQLLHAAHVCLALVGVTIGVDWFAVAAGTHRRDWNGTTTWLITALALLTGALTAGYLLLRRTGRTLAPAESSGRVQHSDAEGDWLDDLTAVLTTLGSVASRSLRGPAGRRPHAGQADRGHQPASQPVGARVERAADFVRDHVTAVIAALGLAGSLGITVMQGVGEGWTSPLLWLTFFAIGTGGWFALGMICNSVLHIAVPRQRVETDRSADALHQGSALRHARDIAVIALALGLPASAVLRADVWAAVGLAGQVDSPERFAAVTFAGALLIGVTLFCADLVITVGIRRRSG